MKALILVGGFGTRLMPLTTSMPKPLVPFMNKSMVLHQVEALIEVGVDEVVLAVNYRSEIFTRVLEEWSKKYKIKFTISQETEPMGTAGPLALATKILTESKDPFFVLNSDVICQFSEKKLFARLLKFHKDHGKEGTILVTKVADPSRFGVVVHDKNGQIERFVEKPQTWVGDEINAGVYIFNQDILKRIPAKPTSIERVTFPAMAADKQLYCMTLDGFWMDVGQPRDFLGGQATFMAESKVPQPESKTFANHPLFVGRNFVHPSARFGLNCIIGPDVVIGENVTISNDCYIVKSAIFDGAKIDSGARIYGSIVGWRAQLEPNVCAAGVVLGEGVRVQRNGLLIECKVPQPLKENNTDGVQVIQNKYMAQADYLKVATTVLRETAFPVKADAKTPEGARAEEAAKKVSAEIVEHVTAANPHAPSAEDYPMSIKNALLAMDLSKL